MTEKSVKDSEKGSKACRKCGNEASRLVDVEHSDDFNHDEVCGLCIRKRGQKYAHEGERGQGQRPIEEQHTLDRAAKERGSGWPR